MLDFIPNQEMLIHIIISIGIFLLFLLFRRIFTQYVYKLILKLSRKTPSEFLTNIFLAFEKPISWLFVIIGIYVSLTYLPYFEQRNPIVLKILRSSVIAIVTWGFYNLSSASSLILMHVNKKLNLEVDQILVPFFSKVIRAIILAISLSVIAQEFDYDVNGFVAGLGLGGLAFALAAQDILANLFGGVVIITEKPFSIGDWIMTPSVEGTVEDISFRSTKVRTFAQAVVTVPNKTLANENITNWSKMTKRQVSFKLGVSTETPKEKVERVVKRIDNLLRNHEGVHQETILVNFDCYSESSLEIFIYFFTNSTVWGEFLKIKEDVNLKIMKILDEEGVSIAFPSRSLYIETLPEKLSEHVRVREY